MRKRFVYIIAGLTVFIFAFFVSVSAYDFYREQQLKANLQNVKVGMSGDEAIEILGKPSHIIMSDGPYYWGYDTSSIHRLLADSYERENDCGHLLLEMSYTMDGKRASVIKILDFK